MPLFITEYANMARDLNHRDVAAGMEPALADTSITVPATSAAFNPQTAFVMLHAQEAVCLAWGTAPSAATNKQRMAAGETRYYGVPPGKGFKVAAVAGA